MNTLHSVEGTSTQRAHSSIWRLASPARLVRQTAIAVAAASCVWGASAQTTPTPSAPAAAAAPGAGELVNSALNAPLFYQLLLGELNVRAGEPGTGYSFILDAARKQRDTRLYRRA
eukprot:gene27076-48583_t